MNLQFVCVMAKICVDFLWWQHLLKNVATEAQHLLPLGQACTTRCSTRARTTQTYLSRAACFRCCSYNHGRHTSPKTGAEPPAAGGREVLGAKAAGGNGGRGAEPPDDGNFLIFKPNNSILIVYLTRDARNGKIKQARNNKIMRKDH